MTEMDETMAKLVSGMISEEKRDGRTKKQPAKKDGGGYAPRARTTEERLIEEAERRAQLASWYSFYPCEPCEKAVTCTVPCDAWRYWYKKAWQAECRRIRRVDVKIDRASVMRELRKVFCRKAATKEDRQAALRICRNLFGPEEAAKLANLRGIVMEDEE